MQYSQAKQGRVFVARLEHGEAVHKALETFALQEGIKAAAVIAVGAADRGSGLVVGPKDGEQRPVAPMAHFLDNVHEILAGGTIFPDENGKPVVHIHMACGRESCTVTGCIRKGVKTWQTMEVVIFELLETPARRVMDPGTGFELLDASGDVAEK